MNYIKRFVTILDKTTKDLEQLYWIKRTHDKWC